MILLVTPSERAGLCTNALIQATGEEVVVAESLARATTLLRAHSYCVVVLDQNLLEPDPREADALLCHSDTAIPIEINLAICGADRLVRDVRRAVQRREREERSAHRAAVSKLYTQLNSTITAALLSIESAMQSDELPQPAFEKISSSYELLRTLRRQLEAIELTTDERKPELVI